jgi:hypothetical protein
MDTSEIKESYELLLAVARAADGELFSSYKQLRSLLERVCRMVATDDNLQLTDLSARISLVSAVLKLTQAEQNRLHSVRLTANAVLNGNEAPTREKLMRDVKTTAFFVRRVSGTALPDQLYKLLPAADATYHVAPLANKRIERMRVCFIYSDEQYLYVNPLDSLSEQPLRVRYGVEQVNDEFNDTCRSLWPHAQLNLLDVAIYDEDDVLTPSFIVLEPDYLIDISSLAECYREYGSHPYNYLLSRLKPIENARPLLLGNIVNLFLDEWIHSEEAPDYTECMRKAFRQYPIELAACADLYERDKEQQFFSDCRTHFDNLGKVVNEVFPATGYELDRSDAVLEPSYICEALGLQGRLDYMQRDMTSFIEMKSGRADEYTIRGKVEPKENNRVQMLLYQAVLQYSMGQSHNEVKAYLLYSRYPLLYPARSSWAMVRRAINLRNRIVAMEYGVQLHNSTSYTAAMMEQITAERLNERHMEGKYWTTYLRPEIDNFGAGLKALSPLEAEYLYTLYNFTTKELYTSKSGDMEYEGRKGAASLWLSTLADKVETGEILYDLSIEDNHATDTHKAFIRLGMPQRDDSEAGLPNFRLGDAVVLYERNGNADNVTNHLVFKGNIEAMDISSITIRLRATQRNAAVLPADSLYAIEHDAMDTTFRSMYYGLYSFMKATPERRSLLLCQRAPQFDAAYTERIAAATDDFERVALKARAASDYFLLVGPPGTGKTSRALKRMVETFLADDGTNILLMAYTNRAVDEICKSIESIAPAVDYIRIGSELSCDVRFRSHLFENAVTGCKRRSDVLRLISGCRVIVGTVATISAKQELFRMKRFDAAIIDEATQILEPQLLGILCARTPAGADAIGRFIMIGDHKQLPAVVLQRSDQSAVFSRELNAIGLNNMKDSLFERLYRMRHTHPAADMCSDMLCKQGRMHPAVASFSNNAFYGGKLDIVGLAHQTEDADAMPRMTFIPSEPERLNGNVKVNHYEAGVAARIVEDIYRRRSELGIEKVSAAVGIITPYRNQIALIKRELARFGVADLNDILVDTVERFQGSERDIIIYSFCVNSAYQLRFLSNVTEDDGVLIDRKLNVALTRARRQMFITGVPSLLKLNPIYGELLSSMEGE